MDCRNLRKALVEALRDAGEGGLGLGYRRLGESLGYSAYRVRKALADMEELGVACFVQEGSVHRWYLTEYCAPDWNDDLYELFRLGEISWQEYRDWMEEDR